MIRDVVLRQGSLNDESDNSARYCHVFGVIFSEVTKKYLSFFNKNYEVFDSFLNLHIIYLQYCYSINM